MLAVMLGPSSGSRQSPGEIHGLLLRAVAQRHPVRAVYKSRERFLCPHRLGWNSKGDRQVLSYQYGGDSGTGLGPPGAKENWRCMALTALSDVELLEGPWHTAENHLRPSHCIERVEIDADDQPERD
jgi:hypothetical protein